MKKSRGNPYWKRLGPAPPSAVMVSAKRKRRNASASGGLLGEKHASTLIPILGGAGGGVLAVWGADKVGIKPSTAAWGLAAAGGITALSTKGWVRQAAAGVGAAGAALGAIQLLSSARVEAAKRTPETPKRQADADMVTRSELNEALAAMADQQKQQCDLLTALHAEIRKVTSEPPQQYVRPVRTAPQWRGAEGDEYMRNAYGIEPDHKAA